MEYSPSEVKGKPLVKEFITSEYQGSVSAVLNKALVGFETSNFHFPLLSRSGMRVEVLLNATPRYDLRGNIIGGTVIL